MTATDERYSPEASRDYDERFREPHEVTWIANVLRDRYIDSDVEDLQDFEISLRNSVVKSVLSLDQLALDKISEQIRDECTQRTRTGLDDLEGHFRHLEKPVYFVTGEEVTNDVVMHELNGFWLMDSYRIYPVSKGQVIDGDVKQVIYNGVEVPR